MFSAILTSGWRCAIPSRGISASRERGSGIPWFSRALFWERLVQPPGSGTNKFGAVAHFFLPLPSLLWLNRIHWSILGIDFSSESLTFDLFFFRFSFKDLCFLLVSYYVGEKWHEKDAYWMRYYEFLQDGKSAQNKDFFYFLAIILHMHSHLNHCMKHNNTRLNFVNIKNEIFILLWLIIND